MEYKGFKIGLENNNLVLFNKGNEYKIKILDNQEYTYKINKKTISAKGGASGLYNFIKDCINKNFCLCLVDKILEETKKRGLVY